MGAPGTHENGNPPAQEVQDDDISTDNPIKNVFPGRRGPELVDRQQQQGHIEFASSSSFSNQNSQEFNPIGDSSQPRGAHIELYSSSSFSNYHNSSEFKPSRLTNHGHIELHSSSSFPNHSKKRDRTNNGDDSPSRSSISSDSKSGTLPSSPTRVEDGKPTANLPVKSPEKSAAVVSRPGREQSPAPVKKPDGGGSGGGVETGSGQRRVRPSLSILRKTKREKMVKRSGLAFRVLGSLFSLVSLIVMAMDRKQGWALDSFDRYKEFRYCKAVNVIGFIYSAVQALHLGYELATGKSIALQHLRFYLDFTLDQMVTYLLISSSSSAATRIDDWKSNWGKDKFPDMATAAVSMSFLAFAALASTSLISGYVLCTSKST